jgi:hypothetical protein
VAMRVFVVMCHSLVEISCGGAGAPRAATMPGAGLAGKSGLGETA